MNNNDMKQGTERVLGFLDEMNTIPRQSEHMEKIQPWLMEWGQSRGFEVETDAARNVLYRVPATPGYEDAPVIVLQGHMDMVCEKRPEVEHNFQKDPIVSWRDGEWLKARGTTLGADNGVALALFFDLLTDPEAEHPPLEVLMTTDEETGLTGALSLQPGFLKGKILLNLDSEDEGVFTLGCAGGMDTNLFLPVDREALPPGYKVFELKVGGLAGGHSGVDIHTGRANANVLLVRLLREALERFEGSRIGGLSGGRAHNAIPREACGLLGVKDAHCGALEGFAGRAQKVLQDEYLPVEPNLFVSVTPVEPDGPAESLFSPESSSRILDALRLIPHGVKSMSTRVDGMVDTSMNFAAMSTEKDGVKILTNRRSALESRGSDFSALMVSLARLYGGSWETGNGYPPWEPREESPLADRARMVWKQVFGSEAKVEVIHAGLECGIIGSIFPGLDMISFGPTIMNPHSPDEKMFIPSVGRVRLFLRELLKSYRPRTQAL